MKKVQTNRTLLAVLVMQTLILASQWLNGGALSSAQAQVPDGGSQRQQTIDELKSINAKLDRISSFMESGKLQVRTVSADAKHD